MARLLWEPSEERKRNANITKFMEFVNERYGKSLRTYAELHKWSIEYIPEFYASIWDFIGIKASKSYEKVVDDINKFPGAKWFTGAKLNFSENLLRYRDDRTAFIFRAETKKSLRMSYAELYDQVARLAKPLKEMGVRPGDRVVAYMPNVIETVVAMLAATSLGAIWSSCGLELGPKAVLDRFSQIEPKVLFAGSGYLYKGKAFNTLSNVAEVVQGLPSVEKVIVVPYEAETAGLGLVPNAVYYHDLLSKERGLEIQFEQLPSDHPAEILFSSGTTGRPKCIVHGIAATLIAHLKGHIIHYNLKPSDTALFIASPTWMVWNVQASCLGVGNTIVLYDGNPFYPDPGALWKIIQDEKVTFLGCSAAFIDALRAQGVRPKELYDLSSLQGIFQTGSALSVEGFEYIYQAIKDDVYLDSGLGGTDIQTGLVEGSPIQAVYAGEMMGPALGMKVNVYDENGKPVIDKQGELVCEKPFPSVPLYFWGDPDGKKLKEAYFNVYPNIWRHGDYAMVHSDTGGITAFGRSDSVLKPSGVRIGALEIYNVVAKLDGIADSLVVGQNWQGDQRIILFVKLAKGYELNKELKEKIKNALRTEASPRHVPAKIIEVPDIPYTVNMKKVESAVGNIVNGRPVTNRGVLSNPESLDYYEKIAREELQS